MVTLSLGPLLQGQMRTAQFNSAYSLLIICPNGLQCETNLWEVMGWESSDVFRYDLRAFLEGPMRIAKLKSVYNSLIIGLRGFQCEPTYRKSWTGNLLMWSDLTLSPFFKVR